MKAKRPGGLMFENEEIIKKIHFSIVIVVLF